MEEHDPIISFITKENILDEATLQTAIAQQRQTGQSLISVLKKGNLVNEEQLTRVIASAHNIEFVNLSPDMIDPMAAHLLSYEMVNRSNIMPIKKEGKRLLVAMSSPLNLSVRDQIEIKTGYEVVPVAASPNAIKQAINYHFSVRDVTKQTIVSMRLKQEPGQGPKTTRCLRAS